MGDSSLITASFTQAGCAAAGAAIGAAGTGLAGSSPVIGGVLGGVVGAVAGFALIIRAYLAASDIGPASPAVRKDDADADDDSADDDIR